MKIKAAQIVGGISLISVAISNIMYVVNLIVQDYLSPRLTFDFLTWPISFLFEFIGLSLFVFMYKNRNLRFLGFGVYTLFHLGNALYWSNKNDFNVIWLLRDLISWPIFGLGSFYTLGSVFGLLSFVTIVLAVVLSFFDSSPATSISHQTISMAQSTVPNFAPQTQSRVNQGNLSEIEVLGDLLQKGLLTQEEFDRKKREILGFN